MEGYQIRSTEGETDDKGGRRLAGLDIDPRRREIETWTVGAGAGTGPPLANLPQYLQ